MKIYGDASVLCRFHMMPCTGRCDSILVGQNYIQHSPLIGNLMNVSATNNFYLHLGGWFISNPDDDTVYGGVMTFFD